MSGYESAGADPGLRESARWGERARAQDLALLVESLAEHGALHPDLSVEEGTDILLALASPQVHQMLRRDRGRSAEAYREVILKALRRALIVDG